MNLDFQFMLDDTPTILKGLPTTLALTFWSLLMALALACVFGAVINARVPVLRPVVIALNTFIKGIPQIVQLLFFYYGAPMVSRFFDGFLGYQDDPRHPPYFLAAVIALGLNFGAYMTDVVIASVSAVNRGQLEACLSVGMSRRQAWRRVVLPQVVVVSIPDMTNYLVWLLKATSVASIVGVVELLAAARISASDSYLYMEAYVVAALVYWLVCIAIEFGSRKLHNHLGIYAIDLKNR